VVSTFITVTKVLSWSATIAVMFGGALRLGPAPLRQIVRRPALFIRTLLAVWIAVPAVTMVVVLGLRIEGRAAAVMLLMAGCPGIPVLLAITKQVKGAMSTAFVALLLTAATEPLLIPQWTRILSWVLPMDLSVTPAHILHVLVPTIFVPIALGFLLRLVIRPRRTLLLVHVADWVYAVGLAGCMINMAAVAIPLLVQVPPMAILATALVSVGDALIGYWAGWPHPEDQKAIALATALGNPALALAVAEASYPDHRAGPAVAVYLVVRTLALLPVELWLKKVSKRRAPLRRASVH
jgi:BASS family bile acid:Na+ symporter